MNDKCAFRKKKPDPWKLNCTKHQKLCPSYPLLPSLHPSHRSSIHTPALLTSTHQNRALGSSTSHRLNSSFTAKQCPPFCQVQSRDGAAAISQTLQSCARRLMQRRGCLPLHHRHLEASHTQNKLWIPDNPSRWGSTCIWVETLRGFNPRVTWIPLHPAQTCSWEPVARTVFFKH